MQHSTLATPTHDFPPYDGERDDYDERTLLSVMPIEDVWHTLACWATRGDDSVPYYTFETMEHFIAYTQAITGRAATHLWERIEQLEAKVAASSE